MDYKNAQLLLNSAFMLCMVKMLLKGEVGGCALNSHGNYIVDHGKSWNCVYEFLWEPSLGYIRLNTDLGLRVFVHIFKENMVIINTLIKWKQNSFYAMSYGCWTIIDFYLYKSKTTF